MLVATHLPQTQGTLAHYAAVKARSLARALSLEHRSDEFEALCLKMMHPWGARRIGQTPDYLSNVVDDGTPFEFSVALGQQNELRFMVEPLGDPASLPANAQAAAQLLGALAHDYELDLSRLTRVADLFLPEQPRGAFLIWIAAAIRAKGPPEFKLYLNPAARGERAAPQVIEEALCRLGFPDAWPSVGNVLARRGPEADELKYFSLDLTPTPEARVKVYARHHRSTRDVVVAAASACSAYDPSAIHTFLKTAAPDAQVYDGRGPFTCYAFVTAGARSPDSVTTHFPINGYVENDQLAQERILQVHDALQVPNAAYAQALAAVVDHPLAERVGTHSYVSLRKHRNQTRLTVYLPCEAYAPGTVESPRDTRHQSGVTERATGTPGAEPVRHPLFARLKRDPQSDDTLWILVTNLRIALEPCGRSLALAARDLPDPAVRAVLDDILRSAARDGDFSTAHERWLLGVSCEMAMRDRAEPSSSLLSPAMDFGERIARVSGSPDIYERLGAALTSVAFSSEACRAVGNLLRQSTDFCDTAADRLPTLPAPRLAPLSLAELLAPAQQLRLSAGSTKWANAAWLLMNDLYLACFGKGSEDG